MYYSMNIGYIYSKYVNNINICVYVKNGVRFVFNMSVLVCLYN